MRTLRTAIALGTIVIGLGLFAVPASAFVTPGVAPASPPSGTPGTKPCWVDSECADGKECIGAIAAGALRAASQGQCTEIKEWIDTSGFGFFDYTTIKPRLNINIPSFSFSNISVSKSGEKRTLSIPWLSEYIAALYRWAMPLGAIAAVIVIMIGGVLWLTSGATGQLQKAQEYIKHAVIGLMLLLGSYLIFSTINPDLTVLAPLKVEVAEPIVIKFEDGGEGDGPLRTRAEAIAALDIYCPNGGGTSEIPQIVESMSRKIAYRLGAKGGPPPYGEKVGGPYERFNNSCPDDKICFDCSGFINQIYRCAGLPSPGGSTASMFGDAEVLYEMNPEENTANGIPLEPGDLMGWKSGDVGKSVGHVVIYLGAGMAADTSGGNRNKINPKITDLKNYDYPFYRIFRITPSSQ
ncbi:MAG: NlpC/P60 family protein [Candidatus Uhrbacteria bacterium]